MDQNYVMRILTDAGAIIKDSHVVYTSGRHGNSYINKDAIYLDTMSTSKLAKKMAEPFDANLIDVVAGPSIGGVILSQWVAYHLSIKRSHGDVLSVYAEEEIVENQKRRIFKRGYDRFVACKNVLVVEDIVTTGTSARQVIQAVRDLGGNVVGLSVIFNRGGLKAKEMLGVPVSALVDLKLDSYDPSECPLCIERIAINTSIGKGREFLQATPPLVYR